MKETAIVVAFCALIALCIWLLVRKNAAQQDCIDRGGIIHEYNCSHDHGCMSWQCVERAP